MKNFHFRHIGLLGILCASVANSADIKSDTDTSIADTSSNFNRKYLDNEKKFENLKSFKLASFDSLNSQFIEDLSKTSDAIFYDSGHLSPIIRHERPGLVIFADDLNGVCAEFRAKKSSISPEAYSLEEKKDFVDQISKLGVFGSNVSDTPESFIISRSLVANHFCRDSLRIVASVLNRDQITWLLNYSPSAILCNPELLDQLNNFSMFKGAQIRGAFVIGHYDWFKNAQALKTMPVSALLELLGHLEYDLSAKQLEALDSVRSIHELFKEPEFVENAFAWQVAAGALFSLDECINIDRLIEEINKSPEDIFVDDLKRAIIGFYVHSEVAIDFNLNSMLWCALNRDQFDYSVLVRGLEYLFEQRQQFLKALTTKFSDASLLSDSSKRLIRFFATPSTLLARQAMTIKDEVKGEYCDIDDFDLMTELKKYIEDDECVYYKKIALIFAYLELTVPLLKVPYRMIPGSAALSTLELVQLFGSIQDNMSGKWPRLFLLRQVRDFHASQHVQDDKDCIKVIFNDFLARCDPNGFCEFVLNQLSLDFPGSSLQFVTEYGSIRSPFNDFRDAFMKVYKKLNNFRQAYLTDEGPLNSVMNVTHPISVLENELMAVIQNKFEIEFVPLLDLEILKGLNEFGFLLRRAQVQALFKDEAGRRLLLENRELLYTLPTYEDLKVLDFKAVKFQGQYATMLRTVPLIPLMISFKTDEYVFSDPLGVAWRLFGGSVKEGTCDLALMKNLWRFVPFQFLAEAWQSTYNSSPLSPERLFFIRSTQVIPHLMDDVKGKLLETTLATIQWLIIQELKFIEAFLLVNAPSVKCNDAMSVAIVMNKFESKERGMVEMYLKKFVADSDKLVSQLPSMSEFIEVLKAPLSPIRAGVLLVGNGLMEGNALLSNFSGVYDEFPGHWTDKIATVIKGKARPRSIQEYRDLVENDVEKSHSILRKMLDDLDRATGVKAIDVWMNRLRLLSTISLDGITLTRSFACDPFNLPAHEMVLFHKLTKSVQLTVVEGMNLEDEKKPKTKKKSNKKKK